MHANNPAENVTETLVVTFTCQRQAKLTRLKTTASYEKLVDNKLSFKASMCH